MENSKVQLGIVGLGVGQWHINNYLKVPEAALVALCDVDKAKLEHTAARLNIKKTYVDYRELCEDDEIDAVSVCVPNFLHAPISIYALEHGKHILCEKPLAHTVEAGESILKAAQASGKKAMVAMKLRYSKEAQYIRSLADQGRLGDIYYGFSTYLRGIDGVPGMGGWFTTKAKSGGGALIDNGVHLLDLTWYLMGCPEPVSAMGMTDEAFAPVGRANREAIEEAGGSDFFDVEDFGCGIVRFADGSAAMLDNGWSTFVADPTFLVRVMGTEGGATLGPFSFVVEQEGKSKDAAPAASSLEPMDQFSHFAACVRDMQEPASTIEQGYQMLQMLTALYRSSETGASVAMADL